MTRPAVCSPDDDQFKRERRARTVLRVRGRDRHGVLTPRELRFGAEGGVQLEAPRPELAPGATVRLLDSAHLGQVGRVRSVSAVPRRLTSKVRAPAVEAQLEDGSTLLLPRTAVEVLS